MAAKMPMMATTIINSMSVKPFCSFVISKLLLAVSVRDVVLRKHTTPTRLMAAVAIGVPSASALCQLRRGARLEAMLGHGDTFAFDILRADAVRRETNIGHKLTKIV